ncbi:MAG: hypothetical protein JSV20_06195 [Candidatus Bathyarchaeota archaeon]|nr:MAG: hypothetical protein JSV20_06195 [Candidatus Bathyarchaeota archaeon]
MSRREKPTNVQKKEGAVSTERQSWKTEWKTLALYLFVFSCYGIYLLQIFWSSLTFAARLGNYETLKPVIDSLYLSGKIGLVAFALIESTLIVLNIKRGKIRRKWFLILSSLVACSNLLAYVIISHLYRYVTLVLQ